MADAERMSHLYYTLKDASSAIMNAAEDVRDLGGPEGVAMFVLLKQIEAQTDIVTDMLWAYVRDALAEEIHRG